MITDEKKALEYLSQNQKGTVEELMRKIHTDKIYSFRDRGILKFGDGENYEVTPEGVEHYVREYGQFEKPNFLGI